MPRTNSAQLPQLSRPEHLESLLCYKGSHCNEKPAHCNWRAAPAHHN